MKQIPKPSRESKTLGIVANYQKLSVLMPVYNESRTLRTIIEKVLSSPVELEIELICIDDGSQDNSWEILQDLSKQDPRIIPVQHEKNQGKGAAIITGIQHATGEITLFQDADLEYDPHEYPELINPIISNHADAVFGSRFANSHQRRILMYWHSVANRMLTWLTNVLNDINITDMETCYKAVRTDILKQTPLKSKRFNIEPELTTRLAQWNIRLYEVPISYHGRSYAEGKNIGLRDGFEAVWALFKYRFIDKRFTTHDGYYILERLRRARGFNRWTFSQFKNYIGGNVLEAGCGIGNFTELLLHSNQLICVDSDELFIEMINYRFGQLENIECRQIDFGENNVSNSFENDTLDTIISLNVVEHQEDDLSVLKQFYKILQPGGHAIILVPAHPSLYSKCDETLGHKRRYSMEQLETQMKAAGFELVMLKQYNRLGVYGWYVNKLIGKKTLSPTQVKIFQLLLPFAKLMDLLRIGPGLSLIAVGKKTEAK